MSPYTKVNFPNFSDHGYDYYIFSSPDEEALYRGQLQIVKNYLNTQPSSIENSEQQCILSAMKNVIEQVEAVYHREDSDLRFERRLYRLGMYKRERAKRFDGTLKQLNEVLANIRLIYLPIDYGMNSFIALYENEHLNTMAANMRQLAHVDYGTPLADKIANFQVLIKQLPGASNRYYRKLGIALLLMTVLCVGLILLLANPSVVGITVSERLFNMVFLLPIPGIASFAGSLTFFRESIMTPKLAQAVQELPPPQHMGL